MRLLIPVLLAGIACAQEQRKESAKDIFNRQCAMCHAKDGSGDTGLGRTFKLRDLRSPEVQKQTDSELFNIIANGKGKMPAFLNNLGRENVEALVGYIRTLAGK
jgi:mono/diheme cytochrome c family protein